MSDSDYRRLVVMPAVARQKVSDYLLKDVGQTAPQVHAQHILVDTKDLADSIYQQLQAGADFSETAMQQSNDTGTAENGGDLGWFTHGQMVDQFDAVAFSLQPGQISEPFQTQYGWHIVKVLETDPNRALTDQQMTQYRDSIVQDWVDQQMAAMKISSKVEPTPTPALSSFVPPPDAPPLPTAVVTEEASPVGEASPIGSPVASPVGSPVASPVAGSPIAESTPISSPAP
jgi:peptidyl-prolyl cis-trans isomerase C